MKSLFNELDEGIQPAEDRRTPVVWVRRVVVVEQLVPDAEPLREIEFRRGVNIVATARPEEETDGPVGHNVGKTLLTRLIRYCLGEQQFAREPVRKAVAAKFPNAFTICEIMVEDACWIVARPIGGDSPSASRCLSADDWHLILNEDASTERFTAFMEVVERATVTRFENTLLPHVNRPLRWLDLLAWLSRDQYCRYRHPLEWRATWTESGTADLHNEDAAVLIRLVMDLLDEEEARLIQTHKELLQAKKDKSAEVAHLEQRLSQTRTFLEERLSIDVEALTDDMFGQAARDEAERRRDALARLLDDTDDESDDWRTLREQVEETKRSVTRKDQEISTRTADRLVKEGELQQHKSASSDDFAASFAELAHPCPKDDCPLKNPNRKPGEIDPLRQMKIDEATTDLAALDQLLTGLQNELTVLIQQRDQLLSRFNAQETERRQREREIRKQLSVLDALSSEAGDYVARQRALQEATGALAHLERDTEESRQSQRSARTQIAQRNALLNEHFNRALRSLVAMDVEGTITLDMRGLHLAFGEQEARLGEALATSETVLSLDIACLSAAVCGLGFLPRFAILDSPREADLEPHIYARLFDYLKSIEDAFGDEEASFQYIVTTTTPPPPEMEKPPYLRLTLDAREEDGLLLKKRF